MAEDNTPTNVVDEGGELSRSTIPQIPHIGSDVYLKTIGISSQ